MSTSAMLKRRWPTWVGLAAVVVLVGVGQWLPDEFPNWSLIAAALVYLIFGAVRRQRRLLQITGMLVFGALAVAALTVDEELGRLLLAVGWLGHAAWDVAHYRANKVVPRWYAEVCAVVDVLVAVAVLFVP